MLIPPRIAMVLAILCAEASTSRAETLQVPKDHKTIQAAIDAAKPGDIVQVQPGVYRERVSVKPAVIVISAGDDSKGQSGLKRAEATIIEGAGEAAKGPAVVLGEGAVFDGFTVTKVGAFDEKEFAKHHATHGELLPDEQGALGVGGNFPAVGLPGVSATVRNCIIHNNGVVGIGCTGAKNQRTPQVVGNVVYRNMGGGIGIANGATPIIEKNRCFRNLRAGIGNRDSQAWIVNNECFDNVRAGIGIREGATPIVRGNKCYHNRRAGIGIRMKGTNPIIENNECYENEMAGIGTRDGAAPVIRGNQCYRNKMAGIGARDGAKPIVEGNECYENEMAGIGSRNEASPIIRGNKCYRNKMAGIGSRDGAKPIIETNECYENAMAGIGARDEAEPIVRGNRCWKNEMAGIGARLGAKPVIVNNDCFENQLAGIGAREGALPLILNNRCWKNDEAGIGIREGARAVIVGNECRENKQAGIGAQTQAVVTILNNRCLENEKVAVGLRYGTTAYLAGNELARTGGMPPIVAIRENSEAILTGNRIQGGGVAGILVEGTARIDDNIFEGNERSGSAVWAIAKSDITIRGNRVDRYRNLVNCSECRVTVTDNVISRFQGTAITIKKSLAPATLFGNIALSNNPKDSAAVVEGPKGTMADNSLQDPKRENELVMANRRIWKNLKGDPKRDPLPFEQRAGEVVVQDGPWKLRITFGNKMTFQLFQINDDPTEKKDLSASLESIVFRMRRLWEKKEAGEEKQSFRKEGQGK